MANFAQTDGPFGPMPRVNARNAQFTQVANPGVYRNFRQLVGATSAPPPTVSRTNAGKQGIGCCSECSATERQGS